ncbi:MAG: biopolymer transporter ExbB, partial [Acetobacteraceae bacterium]
MSQTDQRAAEVATTFSQPIRAITTMLLVCILVGAGAWLIHGTVADILRTNPVLNGIIGFVFFVGVLSCFWQVWILAQSVSWIETFVRGTGASDVAPPRLLAPLAALLRSRAARMSISASSSRSIQESVVQRIDEARDITRYLINLLVFLGLLGTFWGLATTVPAVVETIRSLAPQEGESGLDVFGKLMGGLESQLGGMGTAFSSSLLGLAGSLVLGLLELFAGHGQNRFIRELEEWLSSITRLGYAGDGEGADQNALGMLVDHMAQQMEELQALQVQTENNRFHSEMKITELVTAMTALTDRMDG